MSTQPSRKDFRISPSSYRYERLLVLAEIYGQPAKEVLNILIDSCFESLVRAGRHNIDSILDDLRSDDVSENSVKS